MTTAQTSDTPGYGASADDWRHFWRLGLTQDLLPVVSDPNVQISPHSRMQDLGKTPSVFGDDGVVGLSNWPQRVTSAADVRRWSQDSRLGICLQTRNVRALDVDVSDPVIAQRVADAIEVFLLSRLPRRWRRNSGKFLHAFRLTGEYRKRRMLIEGGVIEFLATGQQFVAVGTHPSGVRYEWDGGLPAEIPVMSPEDFEALWAYLAEEFATEDAVQGRAAFAPSGAEDRPATDDPVVEFLEREGWVTGTGQDGRRYVRCPWEGEHTTDTGITATAWFPAGSGGYAQGHFKCLHAHCEGRGRDEFLPAVGYGADDFEVLPQAQGAVEAAAAAATPAGENAEDLPWPNFDRKRTGAIKPISNNLVAALRRPDFCGFHIGLDLFRDEICLSQFGETPKAWRAMTDADYMRIRLVIERRGFEPISKELLRDSISLVAQENAFDSAQEWLFSLKWDGVPRVEKLLTRYFGADDTPYATEMSRYIATALAGRIASPGCKADIVPILEGEQGRGKSTGVAALAPAPEYFVEVGLGDNEEDLARKMRGALVGEIAELDGLHTRALEGIKKFITRTHEKWVPKYKEFSTTFARRLLLIGTTNKRDLLADETGNRRWAPIKVNTVDVAAIERDRDQLWAEGLALFGLLGVCWQDLERMARDAHADYTVADDWQHAVHAWLESPDPFSDDPNTPRNSRPFTTAQVLTGAIGLRIQDIDRRAQNRLSPILKASGYEPRATRIDGHVCKAWHQKTHNA